MRFSEFLKELGISQDLIKRVNYDFDLDLALKEAKSRSNPIRVKSRIGGLSFFREGNSLYKVSCPHCGSRVWADPFCSNCGRAMDLPYNGLGWDIPAKKAKDLWELRRLARRWGYEVIKKDELTRLKKKAGEWVENKNKEE